MIQRSAFTYIELLIVVIVVAILTLAAMPDPDAAAQQEGEEAARIFEADVTYARSASIARPDDPVIIYIDGANDTYWLARESSPETPITHPTTGKPYVVEFGPGGTPGFEHVSMYAMDLDGDNILKFNSVGDTDQATDAVLQLTAGSTQVEVKISSVASNATVNKGLTVAATAIAKNTDASENAAEAAEQGQETAEAAQEAAAAAAAEAAEKAAKAAGNAKGNGNG